MERPVVSDIWEHLSWKRQKLEQRNRKKGEIFFILNEQQKVICGTWDNYKGWLVFLCLPKEGIKKRILDWRRMGVSFIHSLRNYKDVRRSVRGIGGRDPIYIFYYLTGTEYHVYLVRVLWGHICTISKLDSQTHSLYIERWKEAGKAVAESGPELGYHRFSSITWNYDINILQLLPPSIYHLGVIAPDRGKLRYLHDTQPASLLGTENRGQEKYF